MLASADARSFSSNDDRFQHCMFCGKGLVVLPNDRRGGACFDCLALTGIETSACPDCGTLLSGEDRLIGCPTCGWTPPLA
jgi:RNA polymerase subunit RPABC4/transcription elongation factor Spt4